MFVDLKSEMIRPDKTAFYSIKDFKMSSHLKDALREMLVREGERNVVVSDYSTKVQVASGNVVYFPNQYYVMAVLSKKYAEALYQYFYFFDENIKNDRNLWPQLSGRQYAVLNQMIHEPSDVELFRRFLDEDDYRGGKNIFNNGEPRASKDVFGSYILKRIPVPDSSSNYLGCLIYYLSKNTEVYASLENAVTRFIPRRVLLEYDNRAATFLKKVVGRTLLVDENLQSFRGFRTTERNLYTGNMRVGCRMGNLPPRVSDYDTSVVWMYDENQYCICLEITSDQMERAFVPAYNNSYAGKLAIEKDGQTYKLYQMFVDGEKNMKYQKIFFGAPGTGKSHKIDAPVAENGCGLKEISQDRKFRTTFHPDYDYAQFVGAYKPKKKPAGITYTFVPQVFAKAYVTAWQKFLNAEIPANDKSVYLVIEEINRGNCAQIFGDIFQLLDRRDGHSEYPVDVDSDFAKYIKDELGDVLFGAYKDAVCSYCEDAEAAHDVANGDFCKIALPPNFNILATMNTSDQSLFPMDSAFKRRFDWEYVAIDYNKQEADFNVFLDNGHQESFKWLEFISKVNSDIFTVTSSEDKQLGEFFVKAVDGVNVEFDTFLSKVMFYLWDSVYKDETGYENVFFFDHTDANHKDKDGNLLKVTFQSLFENNKAYAKDIVKKMLGKLGVTVITPPTQAEVNATEAPAVDEVDVNATEEPAAVETETAPEA